MAYLYVLLKLASRRSSVKDLAALASQLRRGSLSVTNVIRRQSRSRQSISQENQEIKKENGSDSSEEEMAETYWSDPEESAFTQSPSDGVNGANDEDEQDENKPRFTLWSDSELVVNP